MRAHKPTANHTVAAVSETRRTSPATRIPMRRLAILLLALIAAASAATARTAPVSGTQLAPEPREVLIGRTAVAVAQKRHYPGEQLDSGFAHSILDQYFDSLDPGRFYLTQKDVDRFHKEYDAELPSDLQHGNLEPAFAIYRQFARRVKEQYQYALHLLEHEPSFDATGSFRFERRHAPWAKDGKALDQLWRARVENDALTIMLTGKSWADAVKVLKRRYEYVLKNVDQTTSTDVFSTYMNAYMQALDPHSSYFSPFEAQQFQIEMSLQLQGIGAQLTTRDGYVTIVRILPGGPAAKDGELKPGDRIVGVGQGKDGKISDVVGWRLDDVVKRIRGPKGSVVRLQILPAGALPGGTEKMITLVRNTVELEGERAQAHTVLIRHGNVAYKIGIIDIPSFYANFQSDRDGNPASPTVTGDVRDLIGQLKKQKVSGILLDLRDNGGGSLQEAASLTGLFIPDGPVVQVEDRSGRRQQLDTPNGEQPVWNGPLAVLINRFSASATEIFAGALKDYHRALVFGSQTWGKGTVQTVIPLGDYLPGFKAGEMKLTMAQFFRVTGASTQQRGIRPDIEIPSAIDDTQFGESSYSNALPWKQIAAAKYTTVHDAIGETLPKLQSYFEDVIQKTPRYQLFEREIALQRKASARTTVSLNIDQRKEERKRHRAQELAFDNSWRKLAGDPPFKDLKAADAGNFSPPDIALEASTEMLGAYIGRAPSVAKQFKGLIIPIPVQGKGVCANHPTGQPQPPWTICDQGLTGKGKAPVIHPPSVGTGAGGHG